jgi:putative endonuclease
VAVVSQSGHSPRSPPRDRGRAGDDPRHSLGRLGEELATSHFRRLGFSLLGQNVRTRHGEIDLIVFDGRALVFVEVKSHRARTRRQPVAGQSEPLAWLRPRQRARLRSLAVAWLSSGDRTRPSARDIRFDAVGVIVDARDRLLRLDHIEGAW